MKQVKFNVADQPEFFKVLRKRVNGYFKENGISKYANFNMKFKTGVHGYALLRSIDFDAYWCC